MQNEAVQWDYRFILCATSLSGRIALLYLLMLLLLTGAKLFGIWRTVRPFQHRPPADLAAYTDSLRRALRSIKRWTELTFLLWGIFALAKTTDLLREWAFGRAQALHWCWLQEISGISILTLMAITLVFLAKWNVEKRSERLGTRDLKQY